MRKLFLSLAAIAAVTLLGTGGAFAQNQSNDNDESTVIQNDNSTNNGQQGTGTQVSDDATAVDLGDGSNFVDTPSDVAIGGVAAQATGALAVGGNAASISGDLIEGLDGAVEDGALADGGGVAFGEDVEINDAFAAVGLDGVAVASESTMVEEGSSLTIGDNNTVATASDGSAVVGFNGNAIVVDDDDNNQVIGFGNVVAMTELEQEYSAPIIAGPSQDSYIAGTPGESFVVRGNDGNPFVVDGQILTNNAVGTIETGSVGNVSASAVAGLNDMFFSTGVGNQAHIGSVAANVGQLTF